MQLVSQREVDPVCRANGLMRRRRRAQFLLDLRDDLAVDISNTMQRRGLRLADLRQYGLKHDAQRELSRYLRGRDSGFGIERALMLAEDLDIEIEYRTVAPHEREQAAA